MMIFPLLLSLLAGWLVNLAADILPKQRLAHQGEAATNSPRAAPSLQHRRWRPLVVGVLACVLGWLAYLCTDNWPAGLLLAGQAWFFLAVAVIDLEHRLVLNRMLLAALPVLLLAQWVIGDPPSGGFIGRDHRFWSLFRVGAHPAGEHGHGRCQAGRPDRFDGRSI